VARALPGTAERSARPLPSRDDIDEWQGCQPHEPTLPASAGGSMLIDVRGTRTNDEHPPISAAAFGSHAGSHADGGSLFVVVSGGLETRGAVVRVGAPRSVLAGQSHFAGGVMFAGVRARALPLLALLRAAHRWAVPVGVPGVAQSWTTARFLTQPEPVEAEERRALEAKFGRAMREIHLRAKAEAKLQRDVLPSDALADGTDGDRKASGPVGVAIRRLHRTVGASTLDLTAEAHVVTPEFAVLFTQDEVEAAYMRLAACNYVPR